MNETSLKRRDVLNAMRKYSAGERPFRFTTPRSWYVADARGRPYPAKYIYALAINVAPRLFHTSDAVRELRRFRFDIVRGSEEQTNDFESKVRASDPHGRAERLKRAPRIPPQHLMVVTTYDRNPDVVAAVLERANGNCEQCHRPAPFSRASDGSP